MADDYKIMEAILDLQMSYATPGLEHIITDLDLMEKICGKDVSDAFVNI